MLVFFEFFFELVLLICYHFHHLQITCIRGNERVDEREKKKHNTMMER